MRCPCKDCITLPLCKHESLNILVGKCSIISKYLKITTIKTKKVETKTHITTTTHLHSNLGRRLHKYRIRKIKQFVPHTFKIN